MPFELSVCLATAALLAAGSPVVAIVFAAIVLINAALLTRQGQWDE